MEGAQRDPGGGWRVAGPALGAPAALPHLGAFVYSLPSAFLSLFQLLRLERANLQI